MSRPVEKFITLAELERNFAVAPLPEEQIDPREYAEYELHAIIDQYAATYGTEALLVRLQAAGREHGFSIERSE